MKTSLDCIPCFLRQSLDAARLASDDPRVHEAVVREVAEKAACMNVAEPPPVIGQKIHRIIRKLTGMSDPYRDLKDRLNQIALRLYPGLKRRVQASRDPFEIAVRLAIAGNVIDCGVYSQIAEKDIKRAIDEALAARIDTVTLEGFRQAVSAAGEIFYVADNAGEIVFDRLLIEELPLQKIVVAVKGHPVINDATRSDAEAAGVTGLVTVIDNGSDAPGTILEDCSETFRRRFHEADVVIAKGQGNYETLSDADREIFFLLKAKCPVIADDIGCESGSVVISRSVPLKRAQDDAKEQSHAGI